MKKNAYIEGCHFSRMWKALTWPHHSLREEDYTHNANFIPLLCIEVSMPNQESEWSCICVVSRFLLSTILIFDSGIVPKVWCFCFSFYCTRLRHNLKEEAFSSNQFVKYSTPVFWWGTSCSSLVFVLSYYVSLRFELRVVMFVTISA
jgi:hypothetical protein